MHYVEIELKYKQISGHTDGIYLSKSKKYYLIDYKGSSTRHIDNHQKFKNVFPHHNNVIQIKSYCALVEHLLGINIDGWILIYTARDNPKYSKVIVGEEISKETKRKILRQIDKYDKQYTLVTNCKTWYDVKELVDCKPCKTSEIYYKHYHGYTGCTLGVSGLCFSRKELLQHLKIVGKFNSA
jgi:ribosomal protein L21E